MSGTMSRVLLNALFTDTEVQDGKLVYIFDKKQHAQTLLHNLIVMQDNDEGSLTDVIIISKDDEQFHFHGPILAALSKTLEENLLKQGLGSAASKISKIVMKEDLSSEAVQCLWDYAYTSVATLTPSNVKEVKELAEHYGIASLKRECELQEEENFDDDYDGVELKFKNLPEFILKALYVLLNGSKVCSAAITSSDPLTKIPCHGAILAASSSEFACEDTLENFQVNDATFQAMPPFLRYLYTANLMVEPGTVQQLLEMAVEFNLPGMGHACCCWLKDALSADNVLGVMSIAQAWQVKVQNQSLGAESEDGVPLVSMNDALEDLYQSARTLALKDFLDVQDSDDFLEMSLEELIDLIVDDSLDVNSEEDVFYAVMKWVEVDPETRKVELPNLLQSVRLEHMSVGFLHTIMEHDLVKTNPACVEIVEKALQDLLPQNHPVMFGIDPAESVQISEGTEYFVPDFSPKLCTPVGQDPIFMRPNPFDYEPDSGFNPFYEPTPFDTTTLPEHFDQPYDGNSLPETTPALPRKPDMRLRRNREALLERGKNVDGTPDNRLKENKSKNSVARKLAYPEEDLPKRKDGQPDRRFKVVKDLEKSESGRGVDGDGPCRKDGKPDMRFKVNKMKAGKENGQDAKLKLLPQGPTRKDGKPDMRFKANRFPSEGILCTGPTRKDGKPDMRYAANKQKVNIEYLTQEHDACTKGPKKKDGSLDMRYSENKKAVAVAAAPGPLKKDGTPDMRFAVNKLPSDTTKAAPGPLKKNGTPDMRFAMNKGFSGNTSSGPLKNDGTPDMRYSSNRTSADASARGTHGGISNSNASYGPLKRDGTPDMRYRANQRSSRSSPAGSACANLGGSASGSYTASAASGPLKKDGTPDMRYRSNKSSNSSNYGSGCSSIGGSTMSMSSSSSGSYGSVASSLGPLKRDGTPDMRYRSNKSSSGSSFGSIGSLSSGWSTSSYSSGYSGSSSYSTSSGPLKKDGTPDMRYKANRR